MLALQAITESVRRVNKATTTTKRLPWSLLLPQEVLSTAKRGRGTDDETTALPNQMMEDARAVGDIARRAIVAARAEAVPNSSLVLQQQLEQALILLLSMNRGSSVERKRRGNADVSLNRPPSLPIMLIII